MSGDESSAQFQSEVEHQVARLRELAVKSTDPFTVAKAVAASDADVQHLILEHLAGGERLVEILAFGTKHTEVQVFFRFTPVAELVHAVDAGFLVFADYAKGEVVGIVNPYVLQPEHRPGRPFVAVSRANPLKFASDKETADNITRQQTTFLEKLGVSRMRVGDGFGGIASVRDTRVSTSTKFKGARSDDQQTEYTDDYVDCEADEGEESIA